jgi:DNA-binding IscR family transcriptional regulator
MQPCATHHAEGRPCPVHKSFSEVRQNLFAFYSETNLGKIINDMEGHEDLIKM